MRNPALRAAPSAGVQSPGSRRHATNSRDHMNPRSSSQPSESHSRRFAPDMTSPLGWTIARDEHVTVTVSAPMR
jgi:hypothetical protein